MTFGRCTLDAGWVVDLLELARLVALKAMSRAFTAGIASAINMVVVVESRANVRDPWLVMKKPTHLRVTGRAGGSRSRAPFVGRVPRNRRVEGAYLFHIAVHASINLCWRD